MIAQVRGPVVAVGLDHVVVETGGVGLLVRTTPATAAGARGKDEVTLVTSLVVREDSLTLFGFGAAAERELFDLVQTVSGVGPRLALALLSVHDPATVRRAIAAEDAALLTRVPGIGKKSAERMVLELRDKVGALEVDDADAEPAAAQPVGGGDQVREALVGLGYSAKQAEGAVESAAKSAPDADTSALLRAALRELRR